MNFPIYRKLINGKSFYRIDAMDRLTELQQLGNRWLKHELHAKILPERLLISDILENENGQYENCTVEDFEFKLLLTSQ